LQKYTSDVVAHSVRDIKPWPTAVGAARSGPLAWPRRGALHHSVRGLAVTPVFPKKTKCKPMCIPGSSFMHIADISE
jgi:NAD kinase